ncbi:MAG: RDD family protein [Chloroflexota bacterium]|nr:MAG: RDD family protein [Chloroflexota bacterium]
METTPSDRFVVETPENIRFGYDVADIGSRFLAISIDSLIQGVLYIIFSVAMLILAANFSTIALPRIVNDSLGVIFILSIFVIQFGYFMFFEIIMSGQTPGKRLFNLRVIKDNGYPFGTMDSIVRNLVRIIDFFPIAYGIGVITMFMNRRAKRLGDFAAGTIVVKMRDQVRLSDLQVAPRAATTPTPLFANGIEHLEESDIALAESFLLRRANFVNADQLALRMAQQFTTKMGRGEAPTDGSAATQFLRDTVNEYRRQRG